MANVKIVVSIPSVGKRQEAELPDDVPMKKLIPALITKMNLPSTSPTGEQQSYRINHVRTGKQLGENDTLSSVSVQPDDELKVTTEIQAGGYYEYRKYSA